MEAILDPHLHLIAECRKGCRQAQFELYKRYSQAMYHVALRIVSDTAEAEDVLQEAFLDAFKRLNDFRHESTFGLWLKQIVINRAINCLRKRKAEFVSLEEQDFPAEEADCDEAVQLKVEAIKLAMNALPDGYRVVLSLYLFEGYDHEEIAHILQISEGTSRSQFMRAKKKLYELLLTRGVER